ncbi:protoporphyrinogen oxidase [Aquitalea sp. S1-19]|nr:protoporphyrinogen oxidase [Aquitalea sp. S1-19]
MISSRASPPCCRVRVARSFSTGNKRFSGFIHQGRCRVTPALMLINGQNAIFWHADTMNDNTLQTFPLSPLHVAVVGAGISGLSAAWFMAGQGMTVRVFESGERVGGKIRTLGQNGALFEAGPNTLMAGEAHLAWLDKLGLQVEYPSAQSRHRFVLSQGRYRRLPGGPGALLFGDFFSMGAKWRMLSEPFRRNRPATRPETVAGFFRRRLGDEVLAKAVNPFVGGAQYAAHAALADEELLARLNQELADVFGVTGEACEQVIVRWPEAIAQGSVEVLAAREAAARLAARGIHVCASFLDGVSVPDCMDKGKKLALQLAGASPSLP